MKENQEGRAAVLMKKVNPLMKKCKPIPLSDKYPKNVEKISAADDERSVCSCDEVVQVMPLMIKRMLMEKVGDSQKNLTEAAQVCEEDKTQSSEEQKKILLSRQINVTSLKSQQLDLKGENQNDILDQILAQKEPYEGWGNFELNLQRRIQHIEETADGEKRTVCYQFLIQVTNPDGTYCVEIPAESVENVSWIPLKTGGAARFSRDPRARKALAKIIHMQIKNYAEEDELKIHRNGWRKIEGKWRYVIDTGIIGDSHMRIRGDETQKYKYNAVLVGKKENFIAAMQMNGITPKSGVASFLFLFSHLSMLAALFDEAKAPIKFVTAIIGPTNSRKTSISLCLTKIFNREQIHTPELSFESTVGGIEVMCSRHQDTPVLIDDFHPALTKSKQRELENKLEFVLRRYGDRVAKTRMTDFAVNKRAGYYPVRGGCIITGEDITGVESSLARTIVLHVEKNTVDNEKLRFYQENPLILTSHVYDFIAYITNIQEKTIFELEEKFKKIRSEKTYFYPRYAEVYAQMFLTARLITEYALSRGFMSMNSSKMWLHDISIILDDIIKQNVLENFARNQITLILQAVQEEIYNRPPINICNAGKIEEGIFFDSEYYYVRAQVLCNIVQNFTSRFRLPSVGLNPRRLVNILSEKNLIYVRKSGNAMRKTHMLPGNSKDARRYIWLSRSETEKYLKNVEDF